MMRRQATHWTISMHWAVGASIAVAIALIAFTWLSRQSAQDDLRLSVEELRARGAEFALVALASEERRLPAIATRVAARQLQSKIVDLRDDLTALQRDTQSAHAARAVDNARDLAAFARKLTDGEWGPNAALTPQVNATVQTLLAIENELRRKQ